MAELLAISKTKQVRFPFLDISLTQTTVPLGSSNFRFNLTEFKSLGTTVCWWLREVQQVQDQSGNPAFEYTNSSPWTLWNIESGGNRIVMTPDDQSMQHSIFIEAPNELDVYRNPANYNVTFPVVHSFSVDHQTAHDLHRSSICATGYFNWDVSQNNNFVVIHGIPTAPLIQFVGVNLFLNTFQLVNGQLNKTVT
jgi:hypothetical protein